MITFASGIFVDRISKKNVVYLTVSGMFIFFVARNN